MTSPYEVAEQRQNRVRIIAFGVIFATLPFYCVGLVLWLAAPADPSPAVQPTNPPAAVNTFEPAPTRTIRPTETLRPTVTQFQLFTSVPGSGGSGGDLFATALPGGGAPTAVLPTVVPTNTPFPTQTPAPTLTPVTPTETPGPTNTALPFDGS